MNFRLGQSFFFILIAGFLVTTALIIFQDDPFDRNPVVVPPDDETPFYIASPEVSAEKKLIIHPKNPQPGDYIVVEASPVTRSADLQLDYDFEGKTSELYRIGKLLFAVIGICYDNEPGIYSIEIHNQSGEIINSLLEKEVKLGEKDFKTSRFSMPARVTAGWTAERLAEDREKVREAKETTEPFPLWVQSFIEPLEGRITSEYGAIRYINDNPPRRHAGLDIATEEGEPITAPNRGIVRLADSLLSGGETVILDHGMNLSSTYMHLHTIEVEEGQIVERGEVLGTVGMTGYATGPHLHWEVNIGQTPVNPEQLYDNDLLWIPPSYVGYKISNSN